MYFCRKLRVLAYRQLVGHHMGVVLPSCAARQIQNEFPSDDYTGHQFPPPTP